MARKNTVYLTIPKEKAERIISSSISKLKAYEKNDEKIKFGDDSYGTPASTGANWRITLYDYKFKGEKVKTPDGSLETGVLGTKMVYRSDLVWGKRGKEAVSEYIETG